MCLCPFSLRIVLLCCYYTCVHIQVDTMVAQSLDLPPSAARWRQHQRKQNDKQAARRASGHFPVAAIPWATSSKPAGPAAEMASVDDIVAGAQVGCPASNMYCYQSALQCLWHAVALVHNDSLWCCCTEWLWCYSYRIRPLLRPAPCKRSSTLPEYVCNWEPTAPLVTTFPH